MALLQNFALGFQRRFFQSCRKANYIEICFSESRLIYRILTESLQFSHKLLSQFELANWHLDDYSLIVTSIGRHYYEQSESLEYVT